jgi:LysR family transcriptional regulator of abg operon
MMHIRQLNAFIAVAETGSMRSAAKRLGLTQPSLTKTIRDLETSLGVELVDRTVRGCRTTPLGLTFLERARSISDEISRARQEIRQVAGVDGGVVTIGVSVGASLLVAGEAIGNFVRRHPTVQVRVIEGIFEQLLSGVRQRKLDFSVGGLPSADAHAEIERELLFQNEIVPAVREGHPLRGAAHFADLLKCAWAVTTDEPGYIRFLNDHFQKIGLSKPNVVVRCESFMTLLQLIPRTDMIVALPRSYLRHPLVAGQLHEIHVKERCPKTDFAICRRASTPLTPLAGELADDIRRAAKTVRASVEASRRADKGGRHGR